MCAARSDVVIHCRKRHRGKVRPFEMRPGLFCRILTDQIVHGLFKMMKRSLQVFRQLPSGAWRLGGRAEVALAFLQHLYNARHTDHRKSFLGIPQDWLRVLAEVASQGTIHGGGPELAGRKEHALRIRETGTTNSREHEEVWGDERREPAVSYPDDAIAQARRASG